MRHDFGGVLNKLSIDIIERLSIVCVFITRQKLQRIVAKLVKLKF